MDLPAVVCRYAERFSALGCGDHHVGSPLGAWLVLALVAPAATGELADEIVEALGADAATAHQAAIDLLTHPHPTVSAAAAAWTQQNLTGLDAWRTELPAAVTSGPVPTREQADTWARDHTLGLIEHFPVNVTAAVIVLASALATRVTWLTPFETVDAADLRGPWSETLTKVLRAPRSHAHHAFVTDTERAGRVAVHSAMADGLEVMSVIAEPGVAPADVLAVAHDISLAQAGRDAVPTVSLFDLPLGEHPLWTVTEQQAPQRGEYVEALLPAWHASSDHDLLAVPELAFSAAGQSLQRLARLDGFIDARQSAVARYGRRGFEAAAVTALAVGVSARMAPPPGPYRTATLRFVHPYAVVATARGHAVKDPWHGLPVFAAWITNPDDPQD